MAPKGVAPAPDAKPSADLMAKGSNNERIHSMLLELAETEKVKGDKMRSGAYYKAAASVKKCDEMITSGKQASKLEGVGKKIAEKIDELLTTGIAEFVPKKQGGKGRYDERPGASRRRHARMRRPSTRR